MSPRASTSHFDEERPEWTRRKHTLLARYLLPAVTKLSRFKLPVALVDGYAGANAYGTEAVGSTQIMCTGGEQPYPSSCNVRVFACEPDKGRYQQLRSNLGMHIDSGRLTVYQKPHGECVAQIKELIGQAPAIVFLDPFHAHQMALKEDIEPWTRRPVTDVLGVFMASQAVRYATSFEHNRPPVHPSQFLGPGWDFVQTVEDATNVFFDAVKSWKQFAGAYRLRKVATLQDAYTLFGLSDSEHGLWLLSDAIAKDLSWVGERRSTVDTASLFAESEEDAFFSRLLDFVRPHVREHPDWDSRKLGPYLMAQPGGIDLLFGVARATNLTWARREVQKGLDGANHA